MLKILKLYRPFGKTEDPNSTPRPALSDGRGGEEALSGSNVEPRYIYYRLHTTEGALESNNPIYSNDRSIGRIQSRSVTPPHTAASLKKHLCWIEGFKSSKNCDLYLSLCEKTSVEDSTRILLRGEDPGPGTCESEPIALVIDVSASEKRSSATTAIDFKKLPLWQDEPRYVYYRVYNEKGETTSRTSFTETDISLGRLDVLSVSPPHTGASIKARLAKVEGATDRDIQLFEDEVGEITMKDSDSVALLADAYPGIVEDTPMAFVHEPKKKIAAPKTPASVLSRSKRLKTTIACNWGDNDLAWHSTTVGEIFKTDGVLRNEMYNKGTRTHPCYEAINSSGKRAFLFHKFVTFC